MNLKRAISLILVVTLTALMLAVPAAADTMNADVEAKRRQLEEKYGIVIRYETDPNGAASIGTGSLATLDMALGYVTPGVVRQVSEYFRQTYGSRLTYHFRYSIYDDEDTFVEGLFEEGTSVIEIYLPNSSYNTYVSGDSPITFVHEFAHALHMMLNARYGSEKMQREWYALNAGERYSEKDYYYERQNPNVFVSSYAVTDYMEDFAETFAHGFTRVRAGQGFHDRLYKNGKLTPLGQKIMYIESLLSTYFSGAETAVNNLHRAFSTPIYMDYQGYSLSGEHLQYIGCAYPRYVLRGTLRYLGYEAAQSEWIYDIGGWQVLTTSGMNMLVFPGGKTFKMDSLLKTAA